MSTSLGPALPADLVARLTSPTPPGAARHAVLIATADDAGRPHPALLSHGEILVLDAGRLRVAVGAGSRTHANLRLRAALTLCLVGPDGVHYVKARAREHRVEGGLAVFEADVEDVLADTADDSEGGAWIETGVTFRVRDEAVWLERGRGVRAALERAT